MARILRTPRRRLLVAAALILLAAAPAARAQYTFTNVADNTSGTFISFDQQPSINAAGTVAFWAQHLTGQGIFTWSGGVFTTIADSSSPIFSILGSGPSINSEGTVAFRANIDGGGGAMGLFTGAGGATTTIALTSGPTFGGFGSDGAAAINTAGTVAFLAFLDAGGIGIYLGDGGAGTEVIGSGDALFGSTVTSLFMGRLALNDAGQLTFRYTLGDGRSGIAVATPVPQPGCQSCPADMDGNFAINSNDLQRFIDCVIAAAGGAPTPTCECADVVVDSVVDSQDIAAFVSQLLSPPACP